MIPRGRLPPTMFTILPRFGCSARQYHTPSTLAEAFGWAMWVFRGSEELAYSRAPGIRERRDSGLMPRLWHSRTCTPADITATRKPLLSLRLSGGFLLRLAGRQIHGLLPQDPPRSTWRRNGPDPLEHVVSERAVVGVIPHERHMAA